MTITLFLITVFVAYTLVFAIQEEKLPSFVNRGIRKLKKSADVIDRLCECSFCLGFWMGLLSFGFVYVETLSLDVGRLWLAMGLTSAGTSYILNQITLFGGGTEEVELPPEMLAALQEQYGGDEKDEEECECEYCSNEIDLH